MIYKIIQKSHRDLSNIKIIQKKMLISLYDSPNTIRPQSDKKHEKNKLLQICQLFSSIDFFWKKECTGGTRLMRK